MDQIVNNIEEPVIPWGFDEAAYEIYSNGILDEYIPDGSILDQCQCADLDVDGIDDLLLMILIPEQTDDSDEEFRYPEAYYDVDTVILRGLGDNTYEIAAKNSKVNEYDYILGTGNITAGEGWFKFTKARGTAGGWEYNYLFKYDKDRNDWFYAEYYSNYYGYIDIGRSIIQTPENFGSVSFGAYDHGKIYAESFSNEDDLSVDEEGFKVSVSPHYINLADKEKQAQINQLVFRKCRDVQFYI